MRTRARLRKESRVVIKDVRATQFLHKLVFSVKTTIINYIE